MFYILICDDDPDIVAALKIYLSAEGYGVLEANDGEQAIRLIRENTVHLVLLDIMMPKLNGIAATALLRSENSNIPIILLTAKGEDSDKVLGLNVGADDYITKPFHPLEVVARVKSQLRRYIDLGGLTGGKSCLAIGGIALDDAEKKVTVDGIPVPLTPLEYKILKLLMEHPGKVYSSAEIYRQVWKEDAYSSEGTVAVHIRHLREKLEINPAEPRYLKVVWGLGYKFEKGEKA